MTTKIKLSINGTEIELTPDDVKELRRVLDAFDSASPHGDVHIVIVSPPTFISPPVSVPMWRPIHETAPLVPWEWRITCAGTTNDTAFLPNNGMSTTAFLPNNGMSTKCVSTEPQYSFTPNASRGGQ